MKSFNFIINQFIRCVSGVNLNLSRNTAMVIMLLMLGIGNAWAGDYYYTGFKATGGATGKGYVYASTNNAATPVYETEVTAEEKSSDLGENGTRKYYAWAKAVRGSKFNGWSISGDNGNVSPTSGTNSPITVTVTSAKNKTNTGTAKATWTTYEKVNVTYNPSEDGVYSVTYQYNSYDATTQEITTGDAENLSRTISSENGAQTIGSYKNDVITLRSTSGTFLGWYSDAGFTSTSLLSTDTLYTYTAPTSGSAAVYPKYEHVDKYYGRLTASIAEVPYSMPGGGTIFVSKEEAGTGTYSDAAQTVDNTGMGTTSLKYYLHAQPNDKRYVFRGWYSDAACTSLISTNADYAYTFTSSSTNSASPTLGNVYAAFDFNLYYMQVEVEPAVPGLGMVLVKDNNKGTPEYTDYTTHAEQFLYAYRLTPTANAYLYAKPKYGYKFSGWYDNPDCTGTAKSTANPYTYAAKGTSTDPMNPTIIKLYAKFVEDASTVNITYNKPDQTKGEYTASVLDIAEVDDDFVWTFKEVFTSVGKSANTTQAQHKTDVLRLEAQPKAGYGVTSWTIAGTAKATPSQLYETTGTAAATYGVAFADAKPFLVSTNSTQYATLREALTAVGNSGQITVVQNAYVEAGNYTIPSGVTLLVPYESTGKSYTSPSTNYEKIQEFSSATQYVLLTLGSGVNISLSGKLIVMADLCAPVGGGAGSGAPLSAYGRIAMLENSTITVNSGANLYCWGYITGKEGLVTAKSGAKIHEIFQHQNNPGGSAASGWNEDAFFLNQYYVQNIESPLKMEYGAIETVYAQMTVPSSTINNLSASLIGKDDVGMFALTSSGSYLIRTYDPSTDRITYDIYGNVKLNYISMSVYGMDLNTSKYVLPITSNMSVKCHTLNGNASTFNIQYAVSFIPGAELFADEGVTLNIQNKLIIYDRDEWIGKNFAQFNKYSGGYNWTRSSFTPTRTYIRVNADLVDAKVDLNGTMNVSGLLYTTNSGATIISSNGTGVVKLSSAAPGNSNDIQYSANKLGASIKVPMTPAQLHNGDDSYTLTAGAVANDQFIYSKTQERWLKNPKVVSWNANGGTTEASTLAYSEGSFVGELPAAYKEGHTLVGWYTAADGGTKIDATTKVTANITYYAHWTPKSYTITYRDLQGVAFTGAHVDTPNAHPTTHTFGTATALTGATKEHYTFGGWYRTPSCSGAVVTSIAASECKNIKLYAKWTINTHKLTWNMDGGATSSTAYTAAGDAVAYGTTITYPAASTMTKTNYVFNGWDKSISTMPDEDLTITAQWVPAVASVTANNVTTNYATIQEAFTAANGKTGATVKLLQDITITSEIALTAAMTIDLNGKTIKSTQAAAVGVFKINASGKTVTIKDSGTGGKIDHTANYSTSGSYMYGINLTAGTLNIESGTIYAKNTASNRAYGIYANGSTAIITMSNGTVEAESSNSPFGLYANAINSLTMTGGTFIANGPTSRGIYTKGTTTLTNATITSSGENSHAIFAKSGNLTINSGTYTATGTGTGYAIYFEAGTVTVNGGKFNGISADIGKRNTDYSVALKGGYYVHRTDLDAKCAEHYRVKTLSETHPEYANGYRFTVDNAYTITWQLDGVTVREDEVAYGDTPDYGETPTKPSDEQYDYSFSGWTPNIVQATSDKTYSGSFNANTHYYTIIWKNYNGDILETDEGVEGGMQYGATPQYDGATLTKTGDANRSYNFKGWSPTPASVAGDQVYTAQYNMDIDVVDTPEPMVISEDEEAVVTTVQVSGALRVPEGNTLTTNDLILEATPTSSGEIIGEVVATQKAYFDLSNGAEGFKARTWYAVAVPWQVEVTAYGSANGVYLTNDGVNYTRQVLGSTFDLLWYDGKERALNGPSDACWVYIEDDQLERHTHYTMLPGRAYMIYLTTDAQTIRFERKEGKDLLNTTAQVQAHPQSTGNAKDANWNGIANPATYHAYMNAASGDKGQIYVAIDDRYEPIEDMSATPLIVGQPVFVQSTETKSVVACVDKSDYASHAPRRIQANDNAGGSIEVRIGRTENSYTDRLYISMDKYKEDTYLIGEDLAKAGVSNKVAQMWVERYDARLCANTAFAPNGTAVYPLGISVPQTGEYTIYLPNGENESDYVFLTLNGRVIWNLSYAPYVADLAAGTTQVYGLKRVRNNAPATATDTENTEVNEHETVRKYLIDNKVYIMRNGAMYSVTGQKVQ